MDSFIENHDIVMSPVLSSTVCFNTTTDQNLCATLITTATNTHALNNLLHALN